MKQFLFFDPHPGLMGAAVPIPSEIKKIAEDMAGRILTLDEALALLRAPSIGTIEARPGFISLWIGGGPKYAAHVFRVIRYKDLLEYEKPDD